MHAIVLMHWDDGVWQAAGHNSRLKAVGFRLQEMRVGNHDSRLKAVGFRLQEKRVGNQVAETLRR